MHHSFRLMFAVLVGIDAQLATQASFCQQQGWNLVWADEFDGSKLNASNWKMMIGHDEGTLRQALGTQEAISVEGGNLVLTTAKSVSNSSSYTSGAVVSGGSNPVAQGSAANTWKHGRVCVRAKLPGVPGSGTSQGIWPAHWMMPDTSACWPTHGEIDIMEMINGDGQVHGTYHWAQPGDCNHDSANGMAHTGPADWNSAYHEYILEWDAEHMSFGVDGHMYRTVKPGDPAVYGGGSVTFFTDAYYILLNTAVGDAGSWAGVPGPNTVFPVKHYIDYVRVSQKNDEMLIVT